MKTKENKDYCNCMFVLIMRDINTDLPYCCECGKEINEDKLLTKMPKPNKDTTDYKPGLKTKAMKKFKVYIASPYTKGDVAVNVKVQLDMADRLMDLGFIPFTPLYSHFQHMAHPRPYQDWIELDLEWIPVCDVILRLDGESSGADNEVQHALKYGIDVCFNLDDLIKWKDYMDIYWDKLPKI